MSKNLITLQNIKKTYYGAGEPVHALRSVSLNVQSGEMLAVMGSSGSGKSTLMNLLGCLDKPDAGSYIFAGQDVMSLDKIQLARLRNILIGFVFQNFNLLGRLNAIDNVCLPLVYAGVSARERDKRGRKMLSLVGLEGREHHLPRQLSGGQQQRVAIARALINQPGLLLADEPTGALDTATSEEIMALLQYLHREQGLSVVIVTHEPDIAQHCQRIIRLSDGLVVAEEQVLKPLQAQIQAV
ncbi:ABC transporter ATP-binding protein [Syntrophomonas palmitatica]|uniref:ABC transporter ATP-binding protein n=1 Tax=Syntrophomonas palmitatica TaxID=402877 RepID=UPI0006CFF89C|nr:ABC transporter ATP-binding protein [Syntrophomonas palmitatica]